MKKRPFVFIKVCPHCGNEITHRVKPDNEYVCAYCKRKYTKETVLRVKP